MNYQIITESPLWFILFCLLAGLVYSWVLYRNDKTFTELGLPVKSAMAVFRFVSVTILCFLLMSPLIKTVFTEVEKPIIAVLQDNSKSVSAIRDSVTFLNSYPLAIQNAISRLEQDFDVRTFTIGNHIREGLESQFTDQETDLSSIVPELKARFSGRNLGAVIIATDGLYNKGANPVYTFPELKVPVFPVALGDTTVQRDVIITKINHSKTVFLGNTFPVEITIDARKCASTTAAVTISRQGRELFNRKISITSNRHNLIIPALLDADQIGLNRYQVKISGVDNEISYTNNVMDFYVDVNDNQQNILLLGASPHPDLGAIKNILESNPNYKVTYALLSDFNGVADNFNLVVLHQVPSVANPATGILNELARRELPVWYILGTQSNVSAFNNLNQGIKVTDNRGNTNEVIAIPQANFGLFSIDEEYVKRIADLPPLVAPFGNYTASENIYSLLNQKIGAVKTDMPMLLFSGTGSRKSAVLTGEGIWKWKLHEYAGYGNSEAVGVLVTKTVQYLASRDKQTPFRLIHKNSYNENEPVIFDAEVYNDSGELINTGDVQIVFTDEAGNRYPFTFSRTERAFSLNAGFLPVGVYRFSATSKGAAGNYSQSGSILVNALQAEFTETIANHQMLQLLASKTGGAVFSAARLDELTKTISDRNDIKPVSYSQKRLTDMINLKWIFVLIMLLISAEWLLRKRSGAY